ncbi:MAG: DUF4838 domain-containing protein [Verrucomicrobiaceae bacterium]|nr:DUF4838 domain-containing protein [Verrucomicrobiaceae bacterium]
MKHYLLLLTAFLSTSLSALHATAAPTVLVEDGKARATIMVPSQASPTVNRAAAELQDYLKKMSGARLPVVNDERAVEGTRIDVGLTQFTREQLPKDFTSETERVWIGTHERGLAVCGGGDRGTLFAVYRLLETLGCRWLTPEPENEIIPRRASIAVDALHIDTRPAYTWRVFAPGSERWGLKLGLNGFYYADTARTNGGCLFWPRQVRGVHAYHQIMPAKTYFAPHPEWNPLLGGKRVPTELFCQLCVTAPGLADEFAANVIQALDADAQTPVISISPNDGNRWCECETCLALDHKLCGGRTTRQGLDHDLPFVGDRVFWFANEVARRVAKKHPDKKLLILAYVNYAEPPDTIRPEPNVLPFLCHYAPADYSRAIADPSSAANRDFDSLLKRWLAISPDIMFYSYVSKSMWWRLPRPVLHTFSADLKYLHQLGVRRYYCQSDLKDWALDGPLYYVLAKLMWDPSANPDAIAREWIEGMFGPCAPAMTEFYAEVEKAVTTTGKSYTETPRTQVAGLYDRACLDLAMAAIERAELIAKSDPAVSRRVAAVASTFRYGFWMIEWIEQLAKIEHTGDWSRLEDAAAAGRKAISFGPAPEGTVPALCVSNSNFGKEETKGGRACWNSDQTGPGDKASGWADFHLPVADSKRSFVLEMDVWGESEMSSLEIDSVADGWKKITPLQPLDHQPQWNTLRFRITPEVMAPGQTTQHFGLGGGDSQIWIAAIRAHSAEASKPAGSAAEKAK